jgi:hypothetical protein
MRTTSALKTLPDWRQHDTATVTEKKNFTKKLLQVHPEKKEKIG